MTEVFIKPSEAKTLADAAALERGELYDGLGRRRIIHPDHVGKENPKLVSYSRVTTFISAIEDSTNLQKWRTRLTLEGLMNPEVQFEESMWGALSRRNEATMNSADPKVLESAAKEYRAELQDLADRAFNRAGGHDSADYGTALHELADAWHTGELGESDVDYAEAIWPGISADFAAYQESFNQFTEATGAKILHTEAMLVDDKAKLSGRTDIIALAKLPGDQRARRVIMDIKTGKVDNGQKLSQQLAKYAESKLYDPKTGERSGLRVRQDVAIIIHLPRGEARAEYLLVQLAPGRAANSLCAKIRAARRKVPGISAPLDLEP